MKAPLTLRVVGDASNRRDIVSYGKAVALYAAADPAIQPELPSFLGAFTYPTAMLTHVRADWLDQGLRRALRRPRAAVRPRRRGHRRGQPQRSQALPLPGRSVRSADRLLLGEQRVSPFGPDRRLDRACLRQTRGSPGHWRPGSPRMLEFPSTSGSTTLSGSGEHRTAGTSEQGCSRSSSPTLTIFPTSISPTSEDGPPGRFPTGSRLPHPHLRGWSTTGWPPRSRSSAWTPRSARGKQPGPTGPPGSTRSPGP